MYLIDFNREKQTDHSPGGGKKKLYAIFDPVHCIQAVRYFESNEKESHSTEISDALTRQLIIMEYELPQPCPITVSFYGSVY